MIVSQRTSGKRKLTVASLIVVATALGLAVALWVVARWFICYAELDFAAGIEQGMFLPTAYSEEWSPPIWTPDGDNIVVGIKIREEMRHASDPFIVKLLSYRVSSDGTNLSRLLPYGDGSTKMSVSPNGGEIAYSRAWSIETSTLGGSDQKTLVNPDSEVWSALPSEWTRDVRSGQPKWSPDGSQVAFPSSGGAGCHFFFFDSKSLGGFHVMNSDGSDLRKVLGRDATLNGDEVAYDLGFDWSPDGRAFALTGVSTRPNPYEYTLHIVNADGSGLKKLLSLPKIRGAPKWSPDGSRIAFLASQTRDGALKLYEAMRDGSDLREVADAEWRMRNGVFWDIGEAPPKWANEVLHPTLSPDGVRVAGVATAQFMSDTLAPYDADSALITLNIDGSDIQVLAIMAGDGHLKVVGDKR